MSDATHRPGWWQASDGRWYPPQLQPVYLPTNHPQPTPGPYPYGAGYGYPYGAGYGAHSPHNNLAIISLILSCAGILLGVFLAVVPVIGLVLGIAALAKLKTSPTREGRGLARAGVIVGGVASAFWIFVWGVGMATNFGGH